MPVHLEIKNIAEKSKETGKPFTEEDLKKLEADLRKDYG